MFKQVMADKIASNDFIPIFAGYEKCEKNHSFGPTTRNYYIIHFCLKGCGKLYDKFGNYDISAGELFIIRPDEITTYKADEITPWEYSWIAFEGALTKEFNTERSVYSCPMEIGATIKELVEKNESAPSIYISLIYKLIYSIFSKKKENTDVYEKIKQYVRFNYMEDLTVKSLSDFFGFERSYLYRMFKKGTGTSIKEYITRVRMEQAKLLLENGYSVSNTAYAIGYKDEFNFSKAFKKHYGYPPKNTKKRNSSLI